MPMNVGALGPSQVQVVPSPGVEGDFCTANPRYSAIAGPGGLVAGPGGVVAGRFCWALPGSFDVDSGPQVVSNTFQGSATGSLSVLGLIHREMQGILLSPLTPSSLVIQQGFPVTALNECEMWVKNTGLTQVSVGQKAYANLLNGAATFAATGAPTTAASATTSSIAAATSAFTGSIGGTDGNLLTVTAVSSGTIYPGTTISGGSIAAGTKVTQQLSGTAGGVGTYLVSIPEQSIASLSIAGTYGVLTVGTLTTTLPFAVGYLLNTTGSVVAGTFIWQLLTGNGGTGSTLVVDNNTVVASQTISAVGNVETTWSARSGGAANELVKVSNAQLG